MSDQETEKKGIEKLETSQAIEIASDMVEEKLKKSEDAPKKSSEKTREVLGKLVKKKKKLRMQVQRGRIYVRSTYNNTTVLATDIHGNTLAWSSSGLLGFKGAKKSTTYAAAQVVLDLYEKVQKFGLKDIDVFVKGVGAGRDSAVRTLSQKGFSINLIKDETPIPHNGCRPPKPRRI